MRPSAPRRSACPIYTIALGTPDGQVQVQDQFGQPVTLDVPPDTETLAQIAEITGATAFDAPTAEDLQAVYDNLQSRIGYTEEPRRSRSSSSAAGLAARRPRRGPVGPLVRPAAVSSRLSAAAGTTLRYARASRNSARSPMPAFDVDALRAEFPALARQHDGRPVVFLDGPGGTQVPQRVIDAVAAYYRDTNANSGGAFTTSALTDAMAAEAHAAVADFLGARSPDEIKFGYNMSTLTLHIGRSIGATLGPATRSWSRRLDHEANVSTWRAMAADRGVTVQTVDIRPGRRHARPRGPRVQARRRGRGSSPSAMPATRSASINPVARDRRPGARSRRAHVCRRRRLRAARPDRCRRPRHRLPRLLGLQVVRAAPRRPVRQGRRPRSAAGVQGPARPRPVRDRDAVFEAIAGTLAATDYLRDVGRDYGDVADAPGAEHGERTAARAGRRRWSPSRATSGSWSTA